MNTKTASDFKYLNAKRAARLLMDEVKLLIPNHSNYPEQFETVKAISMLICDKVIKEINERPFYIDAERWGNTKEAINILNHNK